MNYKYIKWSNAKEPRKISIRDKTTKVDVSEKCSDEEIVNHNRFAEEGTVNILSQKHKHNIEHAKREREREQELERKRVPGLIDFGIIKRESSEKRAVCNERISNRYMVIQKSINPFLSTNDYIGDLKIQDTHLRPKNSNV
jgi:hypothetical protein